MAYRVIRRFTDSNDNSKDASGQLHIYEVGDIYPVSPYQGAQTKARLAQLTNPDGPNDNFNGPVIKIEEGD